MADCSFCGTPIEKGAGMMYVKKDGKIYWFCSSKCEKATFKLKQIPRNKKWTVDAANEKKRALATAKLAKQAKA
jgi:large subunit ribosomal protein L24e